MSQPQPPAPARLLLSVITPRKALMPELATHLTARFGPVDLSSRWFDFDYTAYYHPEMGAPLYRRMLGFRDLIDQEQLAPIKLATNLLERDYSLGVNRQINLDPGYLLRERFVLATGKNFTHRIYLQQGIYADLTLIYQKGRFQCLPWTYPDYAAPEMLEFLEEARRGYITTLKSINTQE